VGCHAGEAGGCLLRGKADARRWTVILVGRTNDARLPKATSRGATMRGGRREHPEMQAERERDPYDQ